MRRRLAHITRRDAQTVDVTAFLSLMVILVPFLLVTSVFTRTTILEVQTVADRERDITDQLQLQVVVRSAAFEISHSGKNTLEIIEREETGHSLQSLAVFATQLKSEHPQAQEATVLVEPEIAYEVVIKVLDVLRMRTGQQGGDVGEDSLFPQITLGPAPTAGPGGATGQ